jgi:lysophospholipid acyltransferase (LPLAT)-like uncharacterized protein
MDKPTPQQPLGPGPALAAEANTSDMKRILRLSAMQTVLAWLIGTYLLVTLRTIRWDVHGVISLAPFAEGQSVIAAFWHERLALMPMLWMKARGIHPNETVEIYMLVSQHRDGKLIGSILRRFGVKTFHGSSSRGGGASMRRAMTLLQRGRQVAITPDGPRGPRRVATAGVARLAALSGTPVLPCSAQVSRRRVLRSWDRMVIPFPFCRGILVCESPILVPRHDWEASLPIIERALTSAAERADRLCCA